MTTEQTKRLNELNKQLLYCDADEFNVLYEEYAQLTEIQNQEYRARNEGPLHDYYLQHIAGKAWKDIDQDRWDFYSDWHKDVYGYRPRTIAFNIENR